jgi:hypothetical protein
MSLASALNVLRPTLPYYLALTKYKLLRLDAHTFQFHPHAAAPPIALEMAKTVFTQGASSCIESYVMSRMLSDGPKVFAFDALTCEGLENFDLSVRPLITSSPFRPLSSSYPRITLASGSYLLTPAATSRISSSSATNRKQGACW